MRKLAVFALTLASGAAMSGTAMAEGPYWYQCSHAGSERQIEVAYSDQPSPVPCEVRYHKYEIGQQQTTEVLWSAQYQAGYCERKADAFVEKQRGWGWECQRIAGTPPAAR